MGMATNKNIQHYCKGICWGGADVKVQEYVDVFLWAEFWVVPCPDWYGERQHDVEKLEQIFREIDKKNFLRHAYFARPTI